MKVPHAVGMHAIQVLPGLAWLLAFGSVDEARRVRLVAAAAGYGLLVAVSLLQTFTGLARWDLGLLTGGLLLAGLGAFAVAGTGALGALRPRRALS